MRLGAMRLPGWAPSSLKSVRETARSPAVTVNGPYFLRNESTAWGIGTVKSGRASGLEFEAALNDSRPILYARGAP